MAHPGYAVRANVGGSGAGATYSAEGDIGERGVYYGQAGGYHLGGSRGVAYHESHTRQLGLDGFSRTDGKVSSVGGLVMGQSRGVSLGAGGYRETTHAQFGGAALDGAAGISSKGTFSYGLKLNGDECGCECNPFKLIEFCCCGIFKLLGDCLKK